MADEAADLSLGNLRYRLSAAYTNSQVAGCNPMHLYTTHWHSIFNCYVLGYFQYLLGLTLPHSEPLVYTHSNLRYSPPWGVKLPRVSQNARRARGAFGEQVNASLADSWIYQLSFPGSLFLLAVPPTSWT